MSGIRRKFNSRNLGIKWQLQICHYSGENSKATEFFLEKRVNIAFRQKLGFSSRFSPGNNRTVIKF